MLRSRITEMFCCLTCPFFSLNDVSVSVDKAVCDVVLLIGNAHLFVKQVVVLRFSLAFKCV